EVRQNRQKFFKQLNVAPARVVTAELEHQDTIIRVSSKDAGSGVLDNDYQLKADGLITNEPNLYLLHVVADCLSLPYYDPQHKAVGLAHIGWRNASSGLAKKIIKRMAEEFGTNPASLIVGLGPAIHSCCYAYPKHATQQLLDWQPYLKTEDSGLTHIDLVGFVLDQLKTTGVPTANIKVSSECTAHSPQFFSHYRSQRRNKPEGRLATLIGLKPN
ncbi:MAG: laccase domain-containing protein, partial [Candidatus Kerfeldbacteria bacterium]|nr:laccase domain-containing protein [Candidatus Kerfeldbacteria bacterium]